jgi:sporulation protein YlmC with PRC-barrel domain
MASRSDVSFYKDLLHKPVVDRDGHPIGALQDLSAGPIDGVQGPPCVRNLVVRPPRSRRQRSPHLSALLVLPWDLVASLEPGVIRLRQSSEEIDPAALGDDEVLLREHIMDQQIVDRRGLKLQRVNDIAMALSDGTLCLWGMDTGVHGFLTRLGLHWGVASLFRVPSVQRTSRVIEWKCVDRVERARGWIRLRISRDEVRSLVTRTPLEPEP